MAMSLSIAALASSCSDRIVEDNAPMRGQVPLEVSVAGINDTRSIITGTTLPDTCDFSIFFNSNYPTVVSYEKGTCKLMEPIYLNETTETAPVYAFYPDIAYLTEIAIDTKVPKDYLRGVSVNGNGVETNIGVDNPKARILFDHILARITVNLHKDTTINEKYKLGSFYLGGNNENSYRSAVFNAKNNSFIHFFPNETDSIKGELKDGNYMLFEPEDIITVDFLVIPTETTWMLNISDLSTNWYPLPATKYESGKQYIYDCLLQDDGKPYLTITECDIKPWQSIIKPGVEAY